MAKMWEGRFSKALDTQADDFNSSIHFDCRMFRQDIKGSMAHAAMLAARGIISQADAEAIITGLEGILEDLEAGILAVDMTAEDIVTVKVDLVQAVNIANEDITDEIYSGYASEQTFEVTAVEPDVLWGDVNGDGAIDGTDAMLLNRYTASWGVEDYADAVNLLEALATLG